MESTEFFRQLVERSPEGIVVVQADSIRFANGAAARICGASGADALVGHPLADLVHPDDRAALRSALHEWQTGAADAIEVRLDTTASGTTTVIELCATQLDDGPNRSLQIIVRDVTERAWRDASVRESEQRLTLAIAGSLVGIWDWNLETNACVYSSRWKEMLGYSDDEIEPHVSAWERLVHPDDRVRADRAHESVVAGRPTYEAEFRLRHKDGHYVHVLSRGFPVRREPGGPVVRIVGTHFDLTQRKRAEAALRESEERLSLAFEGAQEGVWDWNLETGAVVYSPRWKQMLGYEEDEIEPHVSAWERLLHPDDHALAAELHESVMRGDRMYEGEFRVRHKHGHYLHVLSRGFAVRRDPGGPVVRIVGTHFDLTERRRAESERARTEFLARLVFAQEDERRRIAREMHDQFGEQLTALTHGIRVLKALGGDNEDLQDQIEALEGVAIQLDRDVDHLVWELRPTALDDLGLRAALANYVQDWSKRVKIAAELHTSGLLDQRLGTEAETTLYRIAQEALTNIAKHAHASRVDVILERRDDHVRLIVEDDGVGFDPTDAAKMSQGVGLVGMQERASLVGATVEIESAVGKGTTILVSMATTPLVDDVHKRTEHA